VRWLFVVLGCLLPDYVGAMERRCARRASRFRNAGIEGSGENSMTTDRTSNPSTGASTFPPRVTEVPTKPAVTGEKADDRAEKTADRLAHKGAKDEQDFDRDNNKKFTK
jgi:hypothetical protein